MKTFVSLRPWALAGVLLVGLATLSGCGWRSGTVSGRVTYQGQPLPGGRIYFVTARGERHGVDLREDGTYSLRGVPSGDLRVGVDNTSLYRIEQLRAGQAPGMPAQVAEQMLSKLPASPGRYVPIPAHYSDPAASGLRATVRRGSQGIDFNLD
jgi:hypothetical protein